MDEMDRRFDEEELKELNERVLTFRIQNMEQTLHDLQVKVNLLKGLETKVELMEKRLGKIEDVMRRGVILER